MTAAFAAVDWGTSSFRLWLVGATGEVLAERRSQEGMASTARTGFAAILASHLGALGAAADLPVVICGMAGARQGWLEAPYVPVPARIEDILAGSIEVPGQGRRVRILPGLAQRAEDAPDVMRGEETQLAGVAPLFATGTHLVCMPGTHSKWVRAADGAVVGFATFLTGELFALLSTQSILRHALGSEPVAAAPDSAAFRGGCAEALDKGHLEPALFRIRAASLLRDVPLGEASARLSGLLVGTEIASARGALPDTGGEVILVASGTLGLLYRSALEIAGCRVLSADADEAVRAGLLEAAKRLGWAARTP